MKDNTIVSVWTDGCYDLVHFGHANLLRQARTMGSRLVVGVHSDEEILKNKGKPVMTLSERVFVLQSIRWVDEVVKDAPFITYPDILDKYNCNFCVHGNDIVLCNDGTDPYLLVKECGRFKTCPRTLYVSSTDIIERVLLPDSLIPHLSSQKLKYLQNLFEKFQKNCRPPLPSDDVVYISGNFEFLHPDLIEYFSKIKKDGKFLLVGVYSNESLHNYFHIKTSFSSLERGLILLACRYVDWVLVNPSPKLTENFTLKYYIKKVLTGDMDNLCSCHPEFYNSIPKSLISLNDIALNLSAQFLWDRIRINQKQLLQKVDKKRKADPDSIR